MDIRLEYIRRWRRSVPVDRILRAQQDNIRTLTPDMRDVSKYEVYTDHDEIYLIRTWPPEKKCNNHAKRNKKY